MRYAVYFAPPPGSALERFGAAWLGRDARTNAVFDPPALAGIDAGRAATITAAPRRYGFHATLKPPFALATGRTERELEAALIAFAARRITFELAPLRLAEIGGFLALIPTEPSAELQRLADDAVRELDVFRAPPAPLEIERRARAPLDARERELLDAWGYPYVFDRWRYHMTLTERLEPAERARVHAALEPAVAPLCRQPLRVDAVNLFVESKADAPFWDRSRFAFGREA